MKLKSVTIKGMHNVDSIKYDFKNLNYLYGRNGSGKTTVLQAIQLGLLGYIPGLNKTKSFIFRHANCSNMSVTLDIDDNGNDVKVTRSWLGRINSSVDYNVEVSPSTYDLESIVGDLELPVFNFNEFVSMTANKLKDWFIDFLPKSEFKLNWRKELVDVIPKNLSKYQSEDMIDENVKSIEECGLSGVDQIRWANTFMKDQLSFKKEELKRLTNTIQSLVYYDDLDMNDYRMEEIDDEIAELKGEEIRRQDYEYNLKSNENIQFLIDKHNCNYDSYKEDPRLEEYNRTYHNIENKLKEARNKDYRQDIEKLTNQLFELKNEVNSKQKVVSGKGRCPYTHQICEDVKQLTDKYEVEIENIKKDITKIDNELSELNAKDNDLNVEIRTYNAKLEELKNKKAKLIDEYDEVESLRGKLVELPENVPENKDYNELIDDLLELKSKYQVNQKYNEMVDTLTQSKFELTNEIEIYKEWIKLTSVNGLQTKVEGCNPFEAISTIMDDRIVQLFGAGYSCHFVLEEKANSFSFGLKGERYVPYDLLSSGEKCMFSLALMMSIVDNSSSPLKLILVDDLFDHLDDHNIKNMFESLINVDDIQMIFAGVKKTYTDFEDTYTMKVQGS